MPRIDVEKARALYPSCAMGTAEWNAFFQTPAGEQAFGRIVYDILDELKSQEERDAGMRRIGRRPQRSAIPLQEVYDTIFPTEFDNAPMREQMRPHVKNQRAFARRANIAQSQVSRILSGEITDVPIEMMESIARACKVRPWRFPEWRAAYVGQLVSEMMLQSPHLGTRVLKGLRNRRARHEGVEL